MLLLLPAIAALSAPFLTHAPTDAGGIVWQTEWETAFTQARDEKRVVLLAINMDGEKANDRLAKETYRSKEVGGATTEIVALIGSQSEHGSGSCSRFAGLDCVQHRAIDQKARAEVLVAGPDDEVIAPQHVLLDGEGNVLLSVAYEISADELIWCITAARRTLDPDADIPMPSGATAPRRLKVGGLASYDAETVRPLTEEELAEVIKRLKSGQLKGGELVEEIIKLLATDHPDAIDAVRAELLNAQRRATGGRRGPEAAERVAEQRRRMVRRIGEVSPASYWEVLTAMLADNDLSLRLEAAVALEQLAAPEAAKELKSRLSKEDDPEVQRGIVRALGTCGSGDGSARKKMLSAAKDKKDVLLAWNALFALGNSAGEKSVAKALVATLESGDEGAQRATALGLAFARDSSLRDAMIASRDAAEPGSPLRGTLEASLAVIDGGDLELIREEILAVCGDTIPRRRWFLNDAE